MRAGPPRGADERVKFINEAEAEVIVVLSSATASQSSTTLSPAVLWLNDAIALRWMTTSKPPELLRSIDEMDDDEEESSDIDTAVLLLNMLDTRRLYFTPSLKPLLDEDDASVPLNGVAPRFASRFAPPFPGDATL